MRTNKTRIATLAAAGAGAAALAVAGFALPASADDTTSETTTHTQVAGTFDALGEAFQTWVGDITAGNVGIDGGLVNGPLVSDVGNGPILSGNDVPVGSGNDVSAPVGSGNDVSVEAPVEAPVGNGNDVGSGNDSGISVGDIGADVDDLVGDISGDVDSTLNGILGGGLLD